MAELKTFKNGAFGIVRVAMLDHDLWFVGKDVALALGHKHYSKAIAEYVKSNDKKVIKREQDIIPGIPYCGLTFINKDGLDALISDSKHTVAEKFEHWITTEVLPNMHEKPSHLSINDHGVKDDKECVQDERVIEDKDSTKSGVGNSAVNNKSTSELQIMTFEGVECYEKEGVAYLKLEDVARGLGFTNVAPSGRQVIRWRRVYEHLASLGIVPGGYGGDYKTKLPDFISENIFYRLSMKAKNKAAIKFQALVADEIIPSIRKTGGYISGQETMSDEELIEKALIVAYKKIEERDQTIKEQQGLINKANEKLEKQKPLVDFSMTVQDAEDGISMDEMAAVISKNGFDIGRNNLFRFLRQEEILKENNIPYRPFIKNGYFKIVQAPVYTNWGLKTRRIPLITGKGQIYITKKIMESDMFKETCGVGHKKSNI